VEEIELRVQAQEQRLEDFVRSCETQGDGVGQQVKLQLGKVRQSMASIHSQHQQLWQRMVEPKRDEDDSDSPRKEVLQ
jgi:hypothetical protein